MLSFEKPACDYSVIAQGFGAICMFVYIQRERDTDRHKPATIPSPHRAMVPYVCLYTYRERETQTDTDLRLFRHRTGLCMCPASLGEREAERVAGWEGGIGREGGRLGGREGG